MKIVQWIFVNFASVLAIVQVAIKLVKEICTAIVNVLFPVFPDNGKFEVFVIKMRSIVDVADTWVQKIKETLLPK